MTERFGEWGKLKVEDLFRGKWWQWKVIAGGNEMPIFEVGLQ